MSNVARVEHGRFGRFTQSVVAVSQSVGQRAQYHAVVSVEGLYPTDRFRIVEVELERVWNRRAVTSDNSRHWNKRFELFRATARARARASATVRRGKSLVQVEMNHIDAHVARPRDAHQRVHVGAVHVHETSCVMNDATNLLDVFLKQAEGV